MAGPVQRAKPAAGFPWIVVVGALGLVAVLAAIGPGAPWLAHRFGQVVEEHNGKELIGRVLKAKPHDRIQVAAGRYRFPGTLGLTKPLTLVGEGASNTFLMASGDVVTLLLAADEGVTLENLTVACPPDGSGNLIQVTHGRAHLERVRLQGARPTSGGFHAVGWAGVGLVGDPRSTVSIHGGSFQDNQGGGLTTRGKLELSDVSFTGNRSYALEVRDHGQATASGLKLAQNQDGIHVSTGILTLTDSTVESSGTALYLGYRSHGIVRHNQIAHNRVGVTVELGSRAIVDGNAIQENSEAGLRVDPRGPGSYGASRVTASGN